MKSKTVGRCIKKKFVIILCLLLSCNACSPSKAEIPSGHLAAQASVLGTIAAKQGIEKKKAG